jgi:endonuclease YncB( thermonuclease family)
VRRFLLLFALALLAIPAGAAAATRGPCGVGAQSPACYFWTGKVTFVGDGDTLSVKLDHSKSAVHVRITGINATEEYVHTSSADDRVGECHANEATARLEQLIRAGGGRVRLSAQDPASNSRGRLRRAVAVKVNGRWRDVGRTLISEGHALWLENGSEWAWNTSYSILAQRAAARHLGIWNPDYCAPGPAAELKLWVNSDADGGDLDNPNGEWVRIKNTDPVNSLPLGGWWVRDSDLRRYVFPAGEVVPPDSTVTVDVGRGTDVPPGTLFWNLRAPVFDNASSNGKGAGDGAYLFDYDGDLRAYMQYPCRVSCSDKLQGKVRVEATYKPKDEFVTLTNTSGSPIDLEGYRLSTPGYGYAFTPPSVIAPGEAMRVYTQGSADEDTPLVKHWGLRTPVLGNTSDKVKLSTFDYIDIGCQAWGSASC